jgi:hypothetical protein
LWEKIRSHGEKDLINSFLNFLSICHSFCERDPSWREGMIVHHAEDSRDDSDSLEDFLIYLVTIKFRAGEHSRELEFKTVSVLSSLFTQESEFNISMQT